MAKQVAKPKAKPSDKKKLGKKKAPPKGKKQKGKKQAPVTGPPFEVFGKSENEYDHAWSRPQIAINQNL